MFLNIMYYDLLDQTTSTAVGSLHINSEQVWETFFCLCNVVIWSLDCHWCDCWIAFVTTECFDSSVISTFETTSSNIFTIVGDFVSNERTIGPHRHLSSSQQLSRRKRKRNERSWCFPGGVSSSLTPFHYCWLCFRSFHRGSLALNFGDLKTQKWLTSILSGFFSSILLTQPLKVSPYSLNRFHRSLLSRSCVW